MWPAPPPLEGLGRKADQGWGEGSKPPDDACSTPPPSLKGRRRIFRPQSALRWYDARRCWLTRPIRLEQTLQLLGRVARALDQLRFIAIYRMVRHQRLLIMVAEQRHGVLGRRRFNPQSGQRQP